MDNFAYLNQIAKTSAPVSKTSGKFDITKLSIIKIALGGIVLFFLIMAIGGLISQLNKKPTELTQQLLLQSTNLNKALADNASYLKSSKLRAINSSLLTVLGSTNTHLTAYLTNNGEERNTEKATKPTDQKVLDAEAAAANNLNQSLTNARLNGILDRIYDNQITLQVSLLLTTVSELQKRNKDPKLAEILDPFHSSLQTIHQGLENASTM